MIKPIPNLSTLRKGKPGYDTRYKLDIEHPLHNEVLVDLREYGFGDASSYYARPNSMTGEPLPGVPNTPFVRKDVAERLSKADEWLRKDPLVRKLLGAPARLRVDDALRPYEVQKYAFEVAWPKILKFKNPKMSDKEIEALVPKYCARPKDKPTPTPHITGGAVDVALINLETGEEFDRGYQSGDATGTAYPDHYEGSHLDEKQNSTIVFSRRVLYHAMTQIAGMYANPEEIWHYGIGDPLSAYIAGDAPYYGIAKMLDVH